MPMDTVRVAYRDDDRAPVIYCVKEMAAKHYGINVEVLKIEHYAEFEASLVNAGPRVADAHWFQVISQDRLIKFVFISFGCPEMLVHRL